ncbi:MAG: hypothetical protein K8L97_29750 [Anaerolineae bacterium]|nr:hypothetical protein [Anaerolineae bacterium]
MSNRNAKPKSKMQAFWPIIGLMLILALGFISWVLAPPVIGFLGGVLPNFPPAEIPPDTMQIFITVVLFVLMSLIISLIVAAAAPRKRSAVNEKSLTKERALMVEEKKKQKLRQRAINRMDKSR